MNQCLILAKYTSGQSNYGLPYPTYALEVRDLLQRANDQREELTLLELFRSLETLQTQGLPRSLLLRAREKLCLGRAARIGT